MFVCDTPNKKMQLFTGFTGVSHVHLSNLCRWDGPEIGIELGCDQGIETRLSEGVWGTVVEKCVFFFENLFELNYSRLAQLAWV